jgi:hypothetical protein
MMIFSNWDGLRDSAAARLIPRPRGGKGLRAFVDQHVAFHPRPDDVNQG